MEHRVRVDRSPETLGALELSGIARGYLVADRMVKTAAVTVHEARPYCPGKFLIVVSGDVASVEAALEAGSAAAERAFWGKIFIPNLMPEVIRAINREVTVEVAESIGVLESFSAVAIIEAADAGVKSAAVAIESISLLQGIGGKAFLVFSGELPDVETAVEAGRARIPEDMFVDAQVIAQFSTDVASFLPGRIV